ncbi:MAG: GtrA family protein [Alphaproteobacteria bacterium]|nr:GtrA family protein [Alphaproteobacteria bacterium]
MNLIALKEKVVMRYAMIGVVNTVFGFSFFPFFYWLFHSILEINILVTLSHLCCALFAFFSHKYLTFRSDEKVHLEGGKFIVTQAITWTINIAMLNVAMALLDWSPFVLQMLISVFLTISNYFVYKYFVFLSPKGKPREQH